MKAASLAFSLAGVSLARRRRKGWTDSANGLFILTSQSAPPPPPDDGAGFSGRRPPGALLFQDVAEKFMIKKQVSRAKHAAALLQRISGLGGLARPIATAAPLEAGRSASCGYMKDSAKLAAPVAGAAPAKSGGGAGKLIMLEVCYFKVPSSNRIRWRLFAVVLLRGRPRPSPESNRRRAEGRRVFRRGVCQQLCG